MKLRHFNYIQNRGLIMDKIEVVKEGYSSLIKILTPIIKGEDKFQFSLDEINILLQAKNILRDKYLSLLKEETL